MKLHRGVNLLILYDCPPLGMKSPCKGSAQARECVSMTSCELSENLCIPVTRRLQGIMHLMYYASSGADADTLHALPVTRHPR